MKESWNRVLHWKGWKIIFPLPLWAAALLFLGCCGGLVWVFLRGLEQWWPAYVIYALSAYSLSALCLKLPGAIRREKDWLENHPKLKQVLTDRELKFKAGLYREQIINFGYGIYKITAGVIVGSAWIGADGIYNLVQAVIQLFQILRRRNPGTILKQWKSYRLCGWLALVMHLTLIGIVFQMVNWNRAEDSGEIMIITTAVFAFYKCISAFFVLAKDRKHVHPIDSSVRMLELTQAFFAIFSLQAGLLQIYGAGQQWEHWLNLASGCAVCLLTASTGVYMIRRANREIKKIQEINHG